jgi:hypothetical protein
MSDQPKPTSGEIVEKAAYACSETTQNERKRVIAEAINAALAAKATELHDEWWERVQDANKQLTVEREKVKPLVDAIQMLRDYQNGCPLPSYEKGWNEAMAMTDAALAKAKEGK